MRLYDKPIEKIFLYGIDVADKTMIMQEAYEGVGSNPFIAFRWSKASGEIYGRGPAVNALSAIKTTNLTIELILENADGYIRYLSIDDDGVIIRYNKSLPGTVIPKAPNSQDSQLEVPRVANLV